MVCTIDVYYHSKTRPFHNLTLSDHSKSGLVRILDHYFSFFLFTLQVTESLSTTDQLTTREEELNRRLEKALHQLDLVHQGINTELDQRWQAEDEILQLQKEIDQVN